MSNVVDRILELFVLGVVLYWVFSDQSNFAGSITALGNVTAQQIKTLQARA